jgi:hypothetical protein
MTAAPALRGRPQFGAAVPCAPPASLRGQAGGLACGALGAAVRGFGRWPDGFRWPDGLMTLAEESTV